MERIKKTRTNPRLGDLPISRLVGEPPLQVQSDNRDVYKRQALGYMAQPFYDELARIEAMADASERTRALENLLKNLGKYFDGGKAEAEAWFEVLKEEFDNGK